MKFVNLVTLVTVMACGSEAKVCPPGQQVDCTCSNGDASFQVCSADGTGFEECECPDDPSPTTATTSQGAGGEGGNGGSPTTTTSMNGGNGPTSTTNTGAGPGSGGGPVTSDCYDENASMTLGGYSAPALGDLGLCTATQIDQAYTACLGPSADPDTCAAFDTANSPCSSCLFYSPDHWLPVVQLGDLLYVNVAVCEALEQNKPNCADSVTEAVVCLVTTCGSCTSASDENACFSEAEFGICDYAFANFTSTCESVLNGNSPACGGGTFQALFDNIATRICGG